MSPQKQVVPPRVPTVDLLVARRHGLTEREAECLAHAATGATNETIGRRLTPVTTVSAVAQHLKWAYVKLRVLDRAAAVYVCTRTGIFAPLTADELVNLQPTPTGAGAQLPAAVQA